MIDWPFTTRVEFFKHYNHLDWSKTTGKKQRDKIKYSLYWSSKDGGLWVEKK